MTQPEAIELLTRVLDPETWTRWDDPVEPPADADPEYLAALRRSTDRTGLDEAVITGEGRIRGRRIAMVAIDFGFLGGSIGAVAAERLTVAVERATAKGMPLFAATASGGTRMQEGTAAFMQMVKVTAAVYRHRLAGGPYVVYLRQPSTGGVFASWGSLGHVTLAEPGALIGFVGPRVYEALEGRPFPAGVQTTENLVDHGIVDAAVAPANLPFVMVRILDVLAARGEVLPRLPPSVQVAPMPDVSAWESVQRSRRPDRPGVRDLLTESATDVTLLSGTGAGEREHNLVLALAKFSGAPCVLLGQDRRAEAAKHRLGPAGLRVARRGLRLAADLRIPLLTVVDTAGASMSREAEEGGLSGEIARCLAEMVTLPAPTLCLLLGQGAGGAALALAPADRIVAAQHAWLSPLQPEGSSTILYRTPDRAAELAERQGVRAADLLRNGIVDQVVPELPDAADEPQAFLERLSRVLAEELVGLLRRDPAERSAGRLERYRYLGRCSPDESA
ncbi:MAG TPA: carboxyl transferase domain-containing protein [Mycobacteriales bacterium]|nr:carboxyl transferase domain-containing protein [Mycobacteriales bacterium]